MISFINLNIKYIFKIPNLVKVILNYYKVK
jgi:hypothetical protein